MNKYINADSLLTKIKAYRPYMYLGEDALSYAIKMVELEPSADVVEVVRCKDCKYFDRDENASESWCECVAHFGKYFAVDENDFCSHGERADE